MTKPAATAIFPRIKNSLTRFRDDDRGAMAVFMLMVFFLMMVFGGIAVDYMRFEIRRVALQQTMDRAALAAANLENTRNPRDVVSDYFTKANLDKVLKPGEMTTPIVTVEEGDNNSSRLVNIRADVRSYNYFMGMGFMPVEYLEGPALTQAVHGSERVEVMLVLDITGSMDRSLGGRRKIDALIEAATLFVNEVKDIDGRNQVSIGIVPYNTQVNLGANLRSQFTATNLPTVNGVPNSNVPHVNCLEVPTTVASFSSTGISTTTPIPISVHADMTGGTTSNYVKWDNTSYARPTPWTTVIGPESYMCAPNAYSEVLLPTMDKQAMLDKISSLRPGGRTSIMMGMRWGVALIDESARPIYSNLLAGEPSMAGRPANNTDPDTRKVIVLMTDGDHVRTSVMRDPYKSGISPIYRSNNDDNFSIRHDRPGNNDYWVPHRGEWRSQPWTNSGNTGSARQLDWSEVWQEVRLSWVARQLYERPGIRSYSSQMNLFRGDYVEVNTMDARLQTNCAAAKASGIEVYGIAFGAGSAGETQIRGCASAKGSDPNDKTGYFFKPQSSEELATVFRDIAAQLSKLRLTL